MTDGSSGRPDPLADVRYRRPTEADHARVVRVVDEWWGGIRMQARLPRLWFQHFTARSWIAERSDGRLVGFLIGFTSAERPEIACLYLVGTDPNHRRRGIGRALVQRFVDDVTGPAVRRVVAVTWPGDRPSVEFHRALGFEPQGGEGAQRLYGTLAHADYDGEGEDRVVFVRTL